MELKTKRLVLREFVEDDWLAVLAYQSTQEYLRYYPWVERQEGDVKAFVNEFIAWQSEKPRYRHQFAVTMADNGRLIGSCGIRKEMPDESGGELGYELDPGCWENGYATEAAAEMLKFAFQHLQLHRVGSFFIAENVASLRVLEKLGFRREGALRETVWMNGRWWDTLVYSILDYEWEARRDHVQEY